MRILFPAGLAKSLVNHITDLVLVLASNGIIAWVSPTSIQSVGFEPEEMYGHPLGEFLHPNYHPCAPKQLTHAVYANNYFESNIRFRRKDGSYTVLHVIGRVFQPTFYDSANESLSKPVSMSTSSMVDPLFSHSSIPSSKLLSPTSKASSASNPVDSQNYVLITCRQYPASKFSSMLDEMIDLQFENKYLKNKLNSTYSLVEQEISELSALHQSHLYTGDRTCIPTEAIHASPSSFSSPESFSSDLYSAMSNSKV
ncbi:blue light receptor [Coelomomyces lativittatus]|nr:blue light receptor [Coelomomyces lativittatus]